MLHDLVLFVAFHHGQHSVLYCGHNGSTGHGLGFICKEHQVAGDGFSLFQCPDLPIGRQALKPVCRIGIERKGVLRNPRIVHTESYEHGIPLTIGDPIPGTVAGIAPDALTFQELIVVFAFPIADLRSRDIGQILRPAACQGHPIHRSQPVGFRLQIRVGVRHTLVGMFMRFQRTDALLLLGNAVASIPMDMGRIRFRTDQIPDLYSLIAAFPMGMGLQTAVMGLLHSNGRKDQCVSGTEHNDAGHDPDKFPPGTAPVILLDILFHLIAVFLSHNDPSFPVIFVFLRSQSNQVIRFSGQIRSRILPTICSWDTQPTDVCLESTDVAR